MKIILSRKGFDSGIGGYASPIMPDGTLLSLTIPDTNTSIRYSDLKTESGKPYINIMKELSPKIKYGEKLWEVINDNCSCHLDPDLRPEVIKRHDNWKPLFGQGGAAQTHLYNNGVKEGDLFLFFGWFRKTMLKGGQIIFDPKDKDGRHIIYGYMLVGNLRRINSRENIEAWMRYHPHAERDIKSNSNNTIYIASENLPWRTKINGAGTFKYNDTLVLTREGLSRSKWKLPDFFKKINITCHKSSSWKNEDGIEYFQSVGRGQEFVVDECYEAEEWAKNLIDSNV